MKATKMNEASFNNKLRLCMKATAMEPASTLASSVVWSGRICVLIDAAFDGRDSCLSRASVAEVLDLFTMDRLMGHARKGGVLSGRYLATLPGFSLDLLKEGSAGEVKEVALENHEYLSMAIKRSTWIGNAMDTILELDALPGEDMPLAFFHQSHGRLKKFLEARKEGEEISVAAGHGLEKSKGEAANRL
jgi:hypothetical protein